MSDTEELWQDLEGATDGLEQVQEMLADDNRDFSLEQLEDLAAALHDYGQAIATFKQLLGLSE